MGNTSGLEKLLSPPKKEEVEKKQKSQKRASRTPANKNGSNRKSEKKPIKAESKEYRSFYISDNTSNLVNRVVNTIKIENSRYTQDMAMNEAFKLLAKANGVKV